MTPTKRKAQNTQPETEASAAGSEPPRRPDAPPGTGGSEPPGQEPPPGSASEGPDAEQPAEPAREPFNFGDVVAVGATLALGVLLLVVFRGRRTFS